MTLSEYITRIKRTNADWQNLMWDEDTIKDMINEGYLDFVRRTHCLRKNSSIAITPETYTLSLPSDIIKVYRYEFNGQVIPARTDDWMDNFIGPQWRELEGDSIRYVVHQLTAYNTIRIYPVFLDFSGVLYDIDDLYKKLIIAYDGGASTTVTLATGAYNGTDLATELQSKINDALDSSGTVTYSNTTGKFTFDAATGHTFSITYSGSTIADKIGILSDQGEAQTITSAESVRLWMDYVYKPTALSDNSDEPVIPEEYHIALYYYAIGQLYQMARSSKTDYSKSLYFIDKYQNMANTHKASIINGRSKEHNMMFRGPSFI